MSIERLHEYARILKICAAADPQSKGTMDAIDYRASTV